MSWAQWRGIIDSWWKGWLKDEQNESNTRLYECYSSGIGGFETVRVGEKPLSPGAIHKCYHGWSAGGGCTLLRLDSSLVYIRTHILSAAVIPLPPGVLEYRLVRSQPSYTTCDSNDVNILKRTSYSIIRGPPNAFWRLWHPWECLRREDTILDNDINQMSRYPGETRISRVLDISATFTNVIQDYSRYCWIGHMRRDFGLSRSWSLGLPTRLDETSLAGHRKFWYRGGLERPNRFNY